MIIAHISDLHFGAEDPVIVEGLIDALRESSCDLVIASGDFTMAARHDEFRRAAEMLRRIRVPVVATPGNHDIPAHNVVERFSRPFARYRRYIGEMTLSEFSTTDAALFTLNTARPWLRSLDWSNGRIAESQALEADEFFSRTSDIPRRALIVHHPLVVPEPPYPYRAIPNAEWVLSALARHRVHAVFAGHLHHQFAVSRQFPVGDATHEIRVLQVGTATSTRRRDQPNGFNLMDWGRRLVVYPHVWDGARFVPIEGREAGPARREAGAGRLVTHGDRDAY